MQRLGSAAGRRPVRPNQTAPVVATFSCPNQLSEEHKRTSDEDLLMLMSAH
jgi:hypothetical protein